MTEQAFIKIYRADGLIESYELDLSKSRFPYGVLGNGLFYLMSKDMNIEIILPYERIRRIEVSRKEIL